MLRRKAEFYAPEGPEAPQRQTSSGHKHTSKRGLTNDENRTMVAKSAAAGVAKLAQVIAHINPCGLNRWRKSEQNANQHGNQKRVHEHRAINASFVDTRNRGRMDGQYPVQQEEGDCDADCTACSGKQHAFSQQLTNDAQRRSTERGADSHFALPGRSTGKQEIGYICAGNQQNETDAAHQHEQCRPHTTRECVIECLKMNTETHVSAWVLPMQASSHGIHFTACLLKAYSMRQSEAAI